MPKTEPTTVTTGPVSEKTRDNLAYIWSVSIIIMVAYIIWRFGDFKEILTLIIGFIAGTASTILALYFGGVLNKTTNGPGMGNMDFSLSASTETSQGNEKNNSSD